MSRTKLMKLGPVRSRVSCRGRGKRDAKTRIRKGPVRKLAGQKRKKIPYPSETLRKPMLNPPKETMIPLTPQDFIDLVGISFYSESQFELSKYHAELVHSGVHVTTSMLRTKLKEIWEKAGSPIPASKMAYHNIVRFLGRCRLLRYAKLKGLKINPASIHEIRREFESEVANEEPVHLQVAHKYVYPHCTCPPEIKVLSDGRPSQHIPQSLPEDHSSKETVSSGSSPSKLPGLLDLFKPPSLLDLFAIPSNISNHTPTSSSSENDTPVLNSHLNHTSASYVSDNSSTAQRDFSKLKSKQREKICQFCVQQYGVTRKVKYDPGKFYRNVVANDYSFPTLLPKRTESESHSEHEPIVADGCQVQCEPATQEGDEIYSALFEMANAL